VHRVKGSSEPASVYPFTPFFWKIRVSSPYSFEPASKALGLIKMLDLKYPSGADSDLNAPSLMILELY
jgi:hypothetical protein